MQVKVIAYGIARDIIGDREWLFDISEEASVMEAMAILIAKFPALDALSSLRMAVNEEYVSDSYAIQKGDELVLIPPVSGG